MKYNRSLCCLILTVVFLISTAALSDTFSLYRGFKYDASLSETRYEYRFEPQPEDVFTTMMENLPKEFADFKELQLRARKHLGTNLITFIPEICDDRVEDLYSGRSIRELEYGALYYSNQAAWNQENARNQDFDFNSDRVTFRNKRYDLCGVGTIEDEAITVDDDNYEYTLSRVYCTPDMFFEITDTFQGVVFQFDHPLSAREEAELNDYMNSLFEVTEYIGPCGIDDYSKQEINKSAWSAVIVLAVCLICTGEIVDYYLSLYDTERKVRRLCGASGLRILAYDAKKMLQLSLIAITEGYLLAIIMSMFEESFFNGVLFDMRFILFNITVFLVLAFIIWISRTILCAVRDKISFRPIRFLFYSTFDSFLKALLLVVTSAFALIFGLYSISLLSEYYEVIDNFKRTNLSDKVVLYLDGDYSSENDYHELMDIINIML